MKYFFILILSSIPFIKIYTQSKAVTEKSKSIKDLRFNISGLLDPLETNFSTGIELGFHSRWSASLDLGYVFYSNYYENAKRTSGILVRPAIRYYIDNVRRAYLEMELHYKNVHNKLTDWLDKGIVNGVPAYSQYQDFTLEKISYGTHLKVGYKARLSKNEKLWLESYFGLGIRSRKESVLNEPDANFNFRNFIGWGPFDNNTNTISVTFPFGFRLLYRL